MANLNGLALIVSELKAEKTNLLNQLRHVDTALSALSNLNGGASAAKPGRTVSAASRRRMARAQRARWAKARQQSQPSRENKTSTAPMKRTMSAAARRKIAAFQRARWAKVKGQQTAQQKKAA
jgi:choline dehydrogenase-like flavoprotein